MASQTPSSPRFSPDDALPPVEPPNAGFILQLFVVPGVIVVVIVMIWLLFNWLAHKGNDADAFVRDLQRNNDARWQAAFNLANELRREHGATAPRYVNNPELAQQLAGILDREITANTTENNSISFRIYLCRALGEFTVPDSLPTLIKVATTQRAEQEVEVRQAALEGIALLAANVGPSEVFTNNKQLDEVLFQAAADTDPRTRSVAAVALGVVGTPQALEKLQVLVEDRNPDVRYNAATRLAHHGDVAAVPVLEEMLDPKEMAGVEAEKVKEMQAFKRSLITLNALRATSQLADKNAEADLRTLRTEVQNLLDGEITGALRIEATKVQQQLTARAEKVAP